MRNRLSCRLRRRGDCRGRGLWLVGDERTRFGGRTQYGPGDGGPAIDRARQRSPASAAPQGVDDGTQITMWSRAATQARAQALVDAYNGSTRTTSA